jgi:hypothetical protein
MLGSGDSSPRFLPPVLVTTPTSRITINLTNITTTSCRQPPLAPSPEGKPLDRDHAVQSARHLQVIRHLRLLTVVEVMPTSPICQVPRRLELLSRNVHNQTVRTGDP